MAYISQQESTVVVRLLSHADSLQYHGLEHARLPCPSSTPGVYSNSCPLSRWCHPTISSSVISFSSAFNLSQHQGLFQQLGSLHPVGKVLELQFSTRPSNEYSGWFPLEITGLVSLLSKGLSRVFSSTTVQKHQFFSSQPSLWSNSCIHTWLLEKQQFWLYWPLLTKWCLCFLICCLSLSKVFFQEASVF